MKILLAFGLVFLSFSVTEACHGCVGKLNLIGSIIYIELDFINFIIFNFSSLNPVNFLLLKRVILYILFNGLMC